MNICTFTKHKTEIVFHLGETRLTRCIRCGAYFSLLFNKVDKKMEWVKGNFIVDVDKPLWILAGNADQYLEAKKKIDSFDLGMEVHEIAPGAFRELRFPQVIFYGTWWNNEGVLDQVGENLTPVLNARY